MEAPRNAPRPKEGRWLAWTSTAWGSGRYGHWYVIDHKGKIITSGFLYRIAKIVGKHNYEKSSGKDDTNPSRFKHMVSLSRTPPRRPLQPSK